MCFTKFKQADNEACNRGSWKWKCVYSRCERLRMGTEIRLLLGRYMIRNAIAD